MTTPPSKAAPTAPLHDHVPTNNHTKVIVLCLIVVAMGGLLFMQYLEKLRADSRRMEGRPPMLAALKDNLKATEMSGKEIDIGQLEGKVWVAGYFYTKSPRGGTVLLDEMKTLQQKYGADPKFQLVSMTLNGEIDTPEVLRDWSAQHGYTGDNWWFLTGDGPKLRAYMKEQMKLRIADIPKDQQQNEFDLWEHKQALVLIDSKLRIRGAYDFSNPEMTDVYRVEMNKAIDRVLSEAKDPTLAD